MTVIANDIAVVDTEGRVLRVARGPTTADALGELGPGEGLVEYSPTERVCPSPPTDDE